MWRCVGKWSCLQAWNLEVKWASMPHGMNEMIDMPGRKFGWRGVKRTFWRGNRSFKRGTNLQSPKSSLEGFNMVQFVNMDKIQHQLIFQLPSTSINHKICHRMICRSLWASQLPWSPWWLWWSLSGWAVGDFRRPCTFFDTKLQPEKRKRSKFPKRKLALILTHDWRWFECN